jgi:hypothetical protein
LVGTNELSINVPQFFKKSSQQTDGKAFVTES